MRALGLLLLLAPGLSAQIVTDRPDFVESSATVGAGAVQIETSVAHERDGGERAWSTPTLLRVGIGPRFELRAESDLLVRSSLDGASESGVADIAVGGKLHTGDGGEGMPATALLLHADLPTGSRSWRGDGVRPSLRLAAEWEFPRETSLGVMPGVARTDGPNGVHTAGIFAAVLGKDWRERAHTFVELAFEHLGSDNDGGTVGTWDGGVTWLLGRSAQLDAMLSLAATSRAPSRAFTIGFSRLLER
jgi:hypothetical protein